MAEDFVPDSPLQEPSDEEMLETEGDEEIGQHLRFRVGYSIKFRRLDKYLCGRFSQFSRSRLQKLIKEQGVNVNGLPAKPSHKLNPRDEIDLILPPRELRELVPEPIPIHVLYEDDEMIVVNKQADLIVHPARGYKSGTLVNGLVYYANQLSKGSDEFRPGIVHRLDKNTTGVLVVAKTDHAHWKLSRQFANRTTNKTYITVVHGVPELDADRINAPIGIHPRIREKCAVRPDGKEAVTYYQVVVAFRGFALVQLRLETGRTHQIRVHMEYIKHPIVADDMYGGKIVYPWQIEDRDPAPEEPVISRVALHAWKLEIKHPTTSKVMEFIAPMPDDMQHFINHLKQFRSI
ncbi:MAG: RluA family pseudouridine synthase [Sedimentisphaerales bacterium]|nr:RluA family pseudouridine synthase [Sedimentisphaerales bacterium]